MISFEKFVQSNVNMFLILGPKSKFNKMQKSAILFCFFLKYLILMCLKFFLFKTLSKFKFHWKLW